MSLTSPLHKKAPKPSDLCLVLAVLHLHLRAVLCETFTPGAMKTRNFSSKSHRCRLNTFFIFFLSIHSPGRFQAAAAAQEGVLVFKSTVSGTPESAEVLVEHVEAARGLVPGDHVSRVFYLEKGEARGADEAPCVPRRGPRRVGGVPRGVGRRAEGGGPTPRQLGSPGAVAHPVAHEVVLTGVDQHVDAALKQGGHGPLALLADCGVAKLRGVAAEGM